MNDEKLKSLGEFGLINLLGAGIKLPADIVGIGDDCAVFPIGEGKYGLMTIDTLVEGRHFKFDFSSAEDIGWKAAAVNISDVSAMGGVPQYALISLTIREGVDLEFIEDVYNGLRAAFNEVGAVIVGGDTVSGKEFSISVSLFGSCFGVPILRNGAKVGDDLWVTGEVGGAALGLKLLKDGHTRDNLLSINRHRRPPIRNVFAQELQKQKLATAMIDVSDGFLQDAMHLVKTRNFGIVLDVERIPLVKSENVKSENINIFELITGGDDYELLFTAPKDLVDKIAILNSLAPVTRVGEITDSPNLIEFLENTELYSFEEYAQKYNWTGSMGYNHF